MTIGRILPRRALLAALTACLALLPSPAPAQSPGARLAPSDTLFEVRLQGGERYVARVVRVDGEVITLETVGGARAEVNRARVRRVDAARGRVVNGEYWREDPNSTRLFFSPTARTLDAGSGYVGVYELFIPFVAYGATPWLTLAGGSPFYLALGGDTTVPFYIAPKVRVARAAGVEAALGALVISAADDPGDEVFGIGYGVVTLGTPDNSITLGAGSPFVQGDVASEVVAMIGGETRVSRGIKLLTENVFIPGEEGLIVSAGIRFFGERLSADAGLAGALGDGSACCFPLVNFVYSLGR